MSKYLRKKEEFSLTKSHASGIIGAAHHLCTSAQLRTWAQSANGNHSRLRMIIILIWKSWI